MGDKLTCPLCDGTLFFYSNKAKEINFKKSKFKIYESFYKCNDCGEEIVDEKTGDKNLVQVYNQYRAKFNILFPSEITELREKYGVNKVKMSLALGWGENTYSNYEKGALPNESHNSLLILIKESSQFWKLIGFRKDLFSKKEIDDIQRKISLSESKTSEKDWINNVWPQKIGSETGYVKPNLEKFANMVLFFAHKEMPYKTKLNKLLFYSDFSHYKRHATSISGCRYHAIKYGPIPNDYDALYGWLSKKSIIDIIESYDSCGVTERIKNLEKFDSSLFDNEEVETLEKVSNKFKSFSATDIKNFSHKEEGWKKNKDNCSVIDYQEYGFFTNL